MFRECNKKDVVYKKAALVATSQVLECFESDRFGVFYLNLLKPLLEQGVEVNTLSKEGQTQTQAQEEDEEHMHRVATDLQLVAMTCLKTSWPRTQYHLQKELFNPIVQLLARIFVAGVYKVKINSIQCLVSIIKSLQIPTGSGTTSGGSGHKQVLQDLVHQVVYESLSTSKYPEIQTQGLELMDCVLFKLREGGNSEDSMNYPKIEEVLEQIQTENGNSMVREKAKDLLKKLRFR
jgi:hypothetical protein